MSERMSLLILHHLQTPTVYSSGPLESINLLTCSINSASKERILAYWQLQTRTMMLGWGTLEAEIHTCMDHPLTEMVHLVRLAMLRKERLGGRQPTLVVAYLLLSEEVVEAPDAFSVRVSRCISAVIYTFLLPICHPPIDSRDKKRSGQQT